MFFFPPLRWQDVNSDAFSSAWEEVSPTSMSMSQEASDTKEAPEKKAVRNSRVAEVWILKQCIRFVDAKQLDETVVVPNEQCSFHPGWLFGIGDEILPSYIGIIS